MSHFQKSSRATEAKREKMKYNTVHKNATIDNRSVGVVQLFGSGWATGSCPSSLSFLFKLLGFLCTVFLYLINMQILSNDHLILVSHPLIRKMQCCNEQMDIFTVEPSHKHTL